MKVASDIVLAMDGVSDGFETTYKFDDVVKAINEARIDAIRECARVATWKSVPPRMTNMDGVEVDKKSILKLIDQIK